MTYIVLARRARDTLIIGENLAKDEATKLAQDSILASTVASAFVIPVEGAFFETSVNRTNPDLDTSRASFADGEAKNHSLNATGTGEEDFAGEKGPSEEKPEVTAKQTDDLQKPDAKQAEKDKVAPPAKAAPKAAS